MTLLSHPTGEPSRLVPPKPGECHVWRLPMDPARWAGFDVLDAGEREQHARFRRVADQHRYQAAHVGARLLLGRYLGVAPAALRFSRRCPHCGCGRGKPVLVDPVGGLDFSLTHSGDWVALAVATEPVGVDVQELTSRADVAALSRTVLAPAELRWWTEQPTEIAHRGFFAYWARKEALLKATGHGLAVPMNTITLSPPDQPARLLDWSAQRPLDRPVRLADFDAGPGYAAAVALLSELPPRIVTARFDPADTQP